MYEEEELFGDTRDDEQWRNHVEDGFLKKILAHKSKWPKLEQFVLEKLKSTSSMNMRALCCHFA